MRFDVEIPKNWICEEDPEYVNVRNMFDDLNMEPIEKDSILRRVAEKLVTDMVSVGLADVTDPAKIQCTLPKTDLISNTLEYHESHNSTCGLEILGRDVSLIRELVVSFLLDSFLDANSEITKYGRECVVVNDPKPNYFKLIFDSQEVGDAENLVGFFSMGYQDNRTDNFVYSVVLEILGMWTDTEDSDEKILAILLYDRFYHIVGISFIGLPESYSPESVRVLERLNLFINNLYDPKRSSFLNHY